MVTVKQSGTVGSCVVVVADLKCLAAAALHLQKGVARTLE